MDKYTFKLLKKEKNKLDYEVKVSKELFKEVQTTVFEEEAAKVKIAGFRPGKAPKVEVEKRIALEVVNKTINKLLPQVTYEILVKESLNPISSVKYDVKNITEESDIEYTFSIVNTPEIKVEDLKKVKVDHKLEEIKNEEVELVIKNIIKSSLPEEKWKKKLEGESENTDIVVTDDLVVELGYEDEKTYEGLKSKVRETLERVKKEQNENDYADKVLKEAVKIADFFIPEEIIEDEVEHREHHFVERLEKLKLDVNTYLKTQNKTLEGLKKEWEEEIRSQVGADILTINLAKQEKLVPTEEEIEAEIEKIEDEIIKIKYRSDEQLRDNLRTMMTRNKGIKHLVDLTKKDTK